MFRVGVVRSWSHSELESFGVGVIRIRSSLDLKSAKVEDVRVGVVPMQNRSEIDSDRVGVVRIRRGLDLKSAEFEDVRGWNRPESFGVIRIRTRSHPEVNLESFGVGFGRSWSWLEASRDS